MTPWECVLCVALAHAPLARATDDRPERASVLLVDPAMPALSKRLREEIESLGLAVTVLPERDPTEPLEVRAREYGAVAAIRVTRSGSGSIEMTIADRTTGKTTTRRLDIVISSDPASAELVATRTVELLRASLMELSADHPARGDVPVTAEIEALAPEPLSTGERALSIALALGPALAVERSSGASVRAWASATGLARSGLGVTLQVTLPVTPARIESSEGRVEVDASVLELAGVFHHSWQPVPLATRFRAGILLSRLAVSGAANSPYVGVREDVFAWGPWLGAGVHWELTRNLGVVVAGDAAFAFPRTVIRSAGRPIATWGRPAGTGRFGLEWTWR
jgi:hypothetical protein